MLRAISLIGLITTILWVLGYTQPPAPSNTPAQAMAIAEEYETYIWLCTEWMWAPIHGDHNYSYDYSGYGVNHVGNPSEAYANHCVCDWVFSMPQYPNGRYYQGVPYAYGRKNTIAEFYYDINRFFQGTPPGQPNKMPGGHDCHYKRWLNGVPGDTIHFPAHPNPPTWYAGIDCSGLVCRSFGWPENWVDSANCNILARNMTVREGLKDVVQGDILVKLSVNGNHVRLVDYYTESPTQRIYFYEAISNDGPWTIVNKVRHTWKNLGALSTYKPGTFYDSTDVSQSTEPADNLYLNLPNEYSLDVNYPNPFNSTTIIRYGLPVAGHVQLTIYNMLGQKVVTLVDENRPAGYYEALWDSKSYQGTEVSSGVYFYCIKANNFMDVKKMVLMR